MLSFLEMKKPLVFSTKSYDYLAQEIVKLKKLSLGGVERKRFPDEEIYLRITDDIAGKDILLIAGTCTDTDTLELIELSFQFVSLGCARLVVFIPYYAYGTMERGSQRGEIVRAKTRARILSLIPQALRGTEVFLFEPHTEGLPYYFENGHRARSVSAESTLTKFVKSRLIKDKELILASVDFGKAKLVHRIAKTLDLEAIYCGKIRKQGSKVETFTEKFDVRGKKVLLIDDMVRTGSSLAAAAKNLRQSGAKEVEALVVHAPVKPTKAIAGLKRITFSNSHPNSMIKTTSRTARYSIATIICDSLLEAFRL